MTNEETIEVLDDMKIKIAIPKSAITQRKRNEALDMAIKALEQQPCKDCISREAVKEMLTEEWTKYMPMESDVSLSFVLEKISELPSVTPSYNSVKTELEQQTRWIPIKTRPMTEEEKEEIGHEYAFMYDCPLPDDGQDVLITDCYGNVEVDTFCRDYEGCYFETNCDDGEVIAWMPLPPSYQGE